MQENLHQSHLWRECRPTPRGKTLSWSAMSISQHPYPKQNKPVTNDQKQTLKEKREREGRKKREERIQSHETLTRTLLERAPSNWWWGPWRRRHWHRLCKWWSQSCRKRHCARPFLASSSTCNWPGLHSPGTVPASDSPSKTNNQKPPVTKKASTFHRTHDMHQSHHFLEAEIDEKSWFLYQLIITLLALKLKRKKKSQQDWVGILEIGVVESRNRTERWFLGGFTLIGNARVAERRRQNDLKTESYDFTMRAWKNGPFYLRFKVRLWT